MTMIVAALLYLSTVTLTYVQGQVTVYNVNSMNLTSLPEDIPSSVEHVSLSNNTLTTIDGLHDLPALTILEAANNKLQTFPDLANVSLTLVALDLSGNSLETVNATRLPALVSLEKLNLDNNPLVNMPDLGPIGGTLQVLYVGGPEQQYDVVPVDILRHLVNISELSFSGHSLEAPPAVCRGLVVDDVILRLGMNVSDCSRQEAAELKLAETLGKVWYMSVEDQPVCSGPPALAAVGWSHLSYRDMIGAISTSGNVSTSGVVITSGTNSTFFSVIEGPFYCYPQISDVIANTSQSVCAVYCQFRSNCVMFASDGQQCVLTTDTPGDSVSFGEYGPWYILDNTVSV